MSALQHLPKSILLLLLCVYLLGLSLSGCRLKRFSSFRIGWEPNIKVLASSSEEELSFVGMYSAALMDKLNNPQIPGLEEAQAALEQEGIPHNRIRKYPETTNRKLGSWQKADTTRERFVLLFAGPAEAQSVRINGAPVGGQPTDYSGSELETVKATVQSVYKVPGNHIKMYKSAGSGELAQGVLWLAGELNTHPGAEALIMICSHGNQKSSYFRMPWDGEGDAEGLLYLKDGIFPEKRLKEWVNLHLGVSDPKSRDPRLVHPVLMIVLACRAGAFVAQAETGNP